MKTIDEIYRELLETFSSQSGYLPSASCDISARLYAVAAQVQALYLQAEWVMGQAFPQTAQGTYLDYHAETRGSSAAWPRRQRGISASRWTPPWPRICPSRRRRCV